MKNISEVEVFKIIEEEADRFSEVFAAMYHLGILTDTDMKHMTIDKGTSKLSPSFISDIKSIASKYTADNDGTIVVQSIHPVAVLPIAAMLGDMIGIDVANEHITVKPIHGGLVDIKITREKNNETL